MFLRFGYSLADAVVQALRDMDALDDPWASDVNIVALTPTGEHFAASTHPDRTYIWQTTEMAQCEEPVRREVPLAILAGELTAARDAPAGRTTIGGKLPIVVDGRRVILSKRHDESERHVLLKALLYARYIRAYPGLMIERSVGLRYKPDLVDVGPHGALRFWGESGATSPAKIAWLIRHVREGHLVFARQAGRGDTFSEIVARAVARERHGRVEVLSFGDDVWDLIGPSGDLDPDMIRADVRSFPATA